MINTQPRHALLVVHPEASIRDQLVTWGSLCGCDVDTVSTAADADAAAEQRRYRLAIVGDFGAETNAVMARLRERRVIVIRVSDLPEPGASATLRSRFDFGDLWRALAEVCGPDDPIRATLPTGRHAPPALDSFWQIYWDDPDCRKAFRLPDRVPLRSRKET